MTTGTVLVFVATSAIVLVAIVGYGLRPGCRTCRSRPQIFWNGREMR
jgi:TctA family transporter